MNVALQGKIETMSLSDVVIFLANKRATGDLSFVRGGIKKTVAIREGKVRSSSSNDPREHLGQFLLNLGHITENQFAKAFETQKETRILLGKILVMTGEVSPAVIKDCLAIKAREALLEGFTWKDGSFTFIARGEADDSPEGLELNVDLADVHREGEFRASAWQLIRNVFPSGQMRVQAAKTVASEADGRILALVRQGLTIDEIILSLHAPDFFVYQRLYALQRDGVVTAIAPPRKGAKAPSTTTPPRPTGSAPVNPQAVPLLHISTRELMGLEVSAPERYLLSRVDGERTVESIVRASPLDETNALAFFAGFVEAGLVTLLDDAGSPLRRAG